MEPLDYPCERNGTGWDDLFIFYAYHTTISAAYQLFLEDELSTIRIYYNPGDKFPCIL